mmetsp:Transcript_6737/g.17243  ORF Transcript_6737/g.17243 Transcript_6737/m.17243 type:complete len:261 (-) Transcript_6737:51-833(-)
MTQLTDEEERWVSSLLEACKTENVHVKNKYEAACYAIVSKGNTKKAIARLKKIRGIESVEALDQVDIKDAWEFLDTKMPGCMQAAGVDNQGRVAIFMDYSAFLPGAIKSPTEWKFVLKAFFNLFDCVAATIEDVRQGCCFVAFCKGMGFNNFSLEMEKKFSEVYQDGYPLKFKQITMVDPPSIISAMINLCKVFLSKKLMDRLQCLPSSSLPGLVSDDKLPVCYGGSYKQPLSDWLSQRGAARKASEGSFASLGSAVTAM